MVRGDPGTGMAKNQNLYEIINRPRVAKITQARDCFCAIDQSLVGI
jgi:hypothetical protein